MKKWIKGLLAMLTAASLLQIPVFAAEEGRARAGETKQAAAATAQTGDATIRVTLHLEKAENTASIEKKDMRVTLQDSSGGLLLNVPLARGETAFSAGTQGCTAVLTPLNEFGVEITTESDIHYYRVDFFNLPVGKAFRVGLSGKGFTDYLSDELALVDYSKHLVVDTASQGFTMGDVNGDQKVTAADLRLVEQEIGGADNGADLNLDGVVDITDIALVNHHIQAAGEPEAFDTALIAQSVAVVQLPDYIHVQGGKAQDILSQNGDPITFSADEGKLVEIPIVFNKAVEMEQLSIVSPDVDGALYGGTVRVETTDGSIEEYSFSKDTPDGVHALARSVGTSTVVINLGKRVAVKKVTVVVTRVQGEDGQATYAVVDHIEFLKDIVPDDPVDNSVPKGVTAQELDGEVRLSWKAVHNVMGYVVRYGTASGTYTLEAATDTTEISIKGLKNLTPYYFVVVAVNGDWHGTPSGEITATPQPKSVPMPPDNVKLTPGDNMLGVSWGKTKNALSYSVYYKESAQTEYTRAADKLEQLSFNLGGLTNGVDYDVYVTASNDLGESKPSLVSTAKPEKQELDAPKIPTLHRILNSDIIDVQMQDKNNVAMSEYPNGFDVRNVIDGDYSTHWTARIWTESRTFTFTFKEEKTMDYVVYVPRLDGNYRKSMDGYDITVWDEAGNKTEVVTGHSRKVKNNPATTGYAILTFPKTEHIKKIAVDVNQWAGSPTNISLSEIAFYNYNSMDDAVDALFTDGSFTELKSGITAAQIEALRAQASDAEGYFVDREILLDELVLAQGLLEGRRDVLGRVCDNVQSRNTQGDLKVVNTFQPLGVTANAGKDIVIYAEIPEGEKVQVVPTQYFAEASSWKGTPVTLSPGRNVITIPKLMTISGAEYGGALYLQYSGGKPEKIKLQVRGAATKIPVLELSGWDGMSESARRAAIDGYITELTEHVKTVGKGEKKIRNATEISLPSVLLSLPADQVLKAVGSDTYKLYNNALAWEELLTLLYRTHGVDDLKAENSRQNIRYMRMFADAFMYASGDHVGVGYASTAALAQGQPVSVTGKGNKNALFGWGIAHEVGHVLDTLGKAETTNNIYSLYAQTYDGGDDTLTSRLEGGKYADIFQKTAAGGKGISNDVFVSLGMYWQLHLAYDGKGENFYNKLNKQYRGKLGGDAAFMEAASAVAGEDLSDFFARWGLGGARRESQGENGTRLINYLDDNSRRARLAGESAASGTVSIAASISGREVAVKLDGTLSSGTLQGYEISRDGQSIAFVVPEEGSTSAAFTDTIGSANNRTLTYSVKAVDVLGYVYAKDTAPEVRIETENVISRTMYQVSTEDDGTVLVKFSPEQSVAGFIVRGSDSVRNMEEDATLGASDSGDALTLGASGNLMTMEVTIGSSSQVVKTVDLDQEALGGTKDITRYFTVSGEEDGRIGIYDDVEEIRIRGWDAAVDLDRLDFIAYSGDNIAITENAIGHLAKDFRDILKAGTLVVTGTYVGDPVYNTIHIEGKFSTGKAEEGEQSLETRPINGDIYLFAQVPGQGDMSEVADGLWIFVPDVQREQELAQGQTCGYSILPAQIRAILYRTDDPNGEDNKFREVSNTRWISVSTEETMPQIVLEGETTNE